MARLPLVPRPADALTESVFEIFDREGREPIALYRALANSPRMLSAYSTLAQALRYQAETPRALRELVILRTAQLTGSQYEWAHHRVMATQAGVPEQKVIELADWRTSDAFEPAEGAALRLAEEMHDASLTDGGFEALRQSFSDSEIVELVLLVAFYQGLARTIQAFGLEVEAEYRRFVDSDPGEH
jgi:alkylhydroperoxidase family enzyme